jgi:hypothetical protein
MDIIVNIDMKTINEMTVAELTRIVDGYVNLDAYDRYVHTDEAILLKHMALALRGEQQKNVLNESKVSKIRAIADELRASLFGEPADRVNTGLLNLVESIKSIVE